MSLIVKIVLPVIVAVAAIWGYLQYTQPAPIAQQEEHMQAPAQQQPAQSGTDISARGTADADLDADLKSIDTQLQVASDSSAAIDAGLSDQSGDTSY